MRRGGLSNDGPTPAPRRGAPPPAAPRTFVGQKFGKSLDRKKILAPPNFSFQKSLWDQWRRETTSKLFQTFSWPFWAISMV
jgi:hypothetical protein